MFITLIGRNSKTLLEDFEASGVQYNLRLPKPGVVMNSGEVVEILAIAIPAAAGVIVAWLKYSPTRKVMITLPDNSIWKAEGKSVAEVEQLLMSAKTIMALDRKKPDKK